MDIKFSDYVPNADNAVIAKGILEHCVDEAREVTCALWALDSLSELAFKPFPSMPQLLQNYLRDVNDFMWRKQASKEEKFTVATKINSDIEVVRYRETYGKTLTDNVGCAWTLEDYMRIWLAWDELDEAKQCWERYRGYPDTMGFEGGKVVWEKRKKDFRQTGLIHPRGEGNGNGSPALDVPSMQSKDSGLSPQSAEHKSKPEASADLFSKSV